MIKRKEIEGALKIATMRGAMKTEGFDATKEILREAHEKSKRKNTILFAMFDPRFCEPGVGIRVRVNSGENKESRVMIVFQRKVNVGLNRFGVPQISVVGNVLEADNRITDTVSLGYGTEMIEFISAKE